MAFRFSCKIHENFRVPLVFENLRTIILIDENAFLHIIARYIFRIEVFFMKKDRFSNGTLQQLLLSCSHLLELSSHNFFL